MAGFRSLLILAAVVIITLPGCSKNQVAVNAGPGEKFTIGIDSSARVTGEDMIITFNEVIGDSRCPENVTCIWQGVASSRVTINYQDTDYTMVLNSPGLTEQAEETFADYTLTYSLAPYPRAGEEISPKDYRLTLTVTSGVTDYSRLLDDIKKGGYEVQADGEVDQLFFSVKGKGIKINNQDVQVFEYEEESAMQAEASQVSPSGSSIGTTMVTWVSAPHFYKAGKLIVLYVGNNTTVTGALEGVLGTQFAGQ